MTMYNTIWRFMNKKELLNELNRYHGLYEISYWKAKKHLPRKERIELKKELCNWSIPLDEQEQRKDKEVVLTAYKERIMKMTRKEIKKCGWNMVDLTLEELNEQDLGRDQDQDQSIDDLQRKDNEND